MAANHSGRAIAGSIRKRFASQIWAAGNSTAVVAPVSSVPAISRSVHVASYDKNIEEHVHSSIVPDNVIEVKSDKYWGPDPRTGVFGPADPSLAQGGAVQTYSAVANGPSTLDEKVWFRPLEDVDKPPHA